jgi:hypothetical protein
MGTKAWAFAPLPPVTLAVLVPADHFYRHLEAKLDLGFLRDLVRASDAGTAIVSEALAVRASGPGGSDRG